MDEGIKLNTPRQERKEEESLQERIYAAFKQIETDEGKELLAYRAVFAGEVLEPEYVELALRRYEKIRAEIEREGDISKLAEKTKEQFAPFNLPEERLQQIAQNIQGYRESYEKAREEYSQYWRVERPKKDRALLEEAKEQGYDLNPESALRAEQDGKYELAYLLYRDSPWKENERMKEIFYSSDTWSHIPHENSLAVWARENNPSFVSVIKSRLDERLRVWSKLSPISRDHNENMVPEYEMIGDFQEAARRAETRPGSLRPLEVEGIPRQLIDRFRELSTLTLTLKRISREELSKRVQAQQGKPTKEG